MIKVLQIISDTNIGGAGRVLMNYLKACDRCQYEIHVALPKNSLLLPVLLSEGAICHEINGMADRSYHKDDVELLVTLIKKLKPDVIHTHGAFSGRLAGKRCRVPVVFSRHSVFPVEGKGKLLPVRVANGAINLRYAQGIIAVSPAAEDNLVELGVPRKKITTILNGVAPVVLPSADHCKLMEKQLNLPSKEDGLVIFGILARLESYKGHRTLLEACSQLKKQGKEFHLLIAGTGQEEEALQALASKLDLNDCVQFLGFVSDVPGLLSLIDVQVNASYGTEATSLALLEGMSLGIPAVVSDYGGNPHVILHGKNGLVFPQENPVALSEAMSQVILNESLRRELSQGAKAIYDGKFTHVAFARNTEQVYCKLAGRKGTHGCTCDKKE